MSMVTRAKRLSIPFPSKPSSLGNIRWRCRPVGISVNVVFPRRTVVLVCGIEVCESATQEASHFEGVRAVPFAHSRADAQPVSSRRQLSLPPLISTDARKARALACNGTIWESGVRSTDVSNLISLSMKSICTMRSRKKSAPSNPSMEQLHARESSERSTARNSPGREILSAVAERRWGQYPRASDWTPFTFTSRPRESFRRSIVARFSTLTLAPESSRKLSGVADCGVATRSQMSPSFS